ncbi:hypothetical protein [Actinoplanes teichomyceticus]|uniref:Uncharacterized protein n=1 Tax=Actinoplanes teichomyceticus TaxID=1867 RepID=A0A561WKM3_ACTTI|nr:hypothetical protein [Actinoplanes teichomyceticus]TWG24414.1 hypothetical protein FHX34_102970 [Actinoplanes teichomyceticus]GIF12735.1 hypothetical protein Ate01nite_27670 [Actinoplanes teichomyceticus]
MAVSSAARRNWLVALGAAALLLVLLGLVLSSCGSDADTTGAAQPGPAVASTLPPVTGPGSPGTLSPRSTGARPATEDPAGAPAVTSTPVRATAGPSRTPSGGVDAGGGAGLPGRRLALLVTGVFLLLAALFTARYAVGRTARD